MNGAYFNNKEYKPLVNEINKIFSEMNDKPTILFDLKGPVPRISKFFKDQRSISVKKGQILKIAEDSVKGINEENLIFLDKNIISSLKIGDNLVVDGCNCVLKVISLERINFKKVSSMKTFIQNRNSQSSGKLNISSSFHHENERIIYDSNDDNYNFNNQLFLINEQPDYNLKEEDFLQGFNNTFFEGETTELIKDRQSNIEEEFKSYLEKNKRPGYDEKSMKSERSKLKLN